MTTPRPIELDIYHTAIPMRSFEHAAATRKTAEAVVVRIQFDDGKVGWGETLPRPYVTGETVASVTRDIRQVLWPMLQDVEAKRDWPMQEIVKGRLAAMAGATMAMLPAYDLLTTSRQTPQIDSRVSGVIGSSDPAKTSRKLRLMRWFGLRDFKLKLGFGEDVDRENLRAVSRQIGKAVAARKCTLRVDVNGGWKAEEVAHRTAELEQYGVCVVEQPTYCPAEQLVELAGKCPLPLMADESLLYTADAYVLLAQPQKIWWNIRISKNGGIAQARHLAMLASEHRVKFVIGCMVGESSLLSAAQRRLLQMIPRPKFVEGNYGRFLMSDDLTDRKLAFGYGGRLKVLAGEGLGVNMDQRKLERYGKLAITVK